MSELTEQNQIDNIAGMCSLRTSFQRLSSQNQSDAFSKAPPKNREQHRNITADCKTFDPRWEQAKCAGNVRWQGDKLQQLFEITEFIGNGPIGIRQEWRDVPKEIAP